MTEQCSPGSEELLPCPFCGGRANVYKNEVDFITKWSVGCGDCNCNMDVCEDTPADAAVEWNTRAPAQSAPPQEMQRKAAEAIRTFCRSLSPAALQMSHGVERIYHSGISVDALACAVVLALSSTQQPQAHEPRCDCGHLFEICNAPNCPSAMTSTQRGDK
jgi:Lar family restriction alleviation protein